MDEVSKLEYAADDFVETWIEKFPNPVEITKEILELALRVAFKAGANYGAKRMRDCCEIIDKTIYE